MKHIIIIHGTTDKKEYFSDKYPSPSNSHWLPWLQKKLLQKGLLTQTPEMPQPYKPVYGKWKKEFEMYEISRFNILVGYSSGGGFLIRWLSENKIKIDKLILVAPWIDPYREESKTFFEFKIDKTITERVREMHIFISKNERVSGVNESFKTITNYFPNSIIHRIKQMGHFTYDDMGTHKFPELLKVILK